jgi:hypothetical protein
MCARVFCVRTKANGPSQSPSAMMSGKQQRFPNGVYKWSQVDITYKKQMLGYIAPLEFSA